MACLKKRQDWRYPITYTAAYWNKLKKRKKKKNCEKLNKFLHSHGGIIIIVGRRQHKPYCWKFSDAEKWNRSSSWLIGCIKPGKPVITPQLEDRVTYRYAVTSCPSFEWHIYLQLEASHLSEFFYITIRRLCCLLPSIMPPFPQHSSCMGSDSSSTLWLSLYNSAGILYAQQCEGFVYATVRGILNTKQCEGYV